MSTHITDADDLNSVCQRGNVTKVSIEIMNGQKLLLRDTTGNNVGRIWQDDDKLTFATNSSAGFIFLSPNWVGVGCDGQHCSIMNLQGDTSRGLLLPICEEGNITQPEEGLLFWDNSVAELKLYDGKDFLKVQFK